MCARLLACPLCSQPGFLTLDALRAGLVSVATRPLACPVCNEVLLGIDKLTIHLFSHAISNPSATETAAKLIEVRTAQAAHQQSWNSVLNAAGQLDSGLAKRADDSGSVVTAGGAGTAAATAAGTSTSGIYIPIDEIENFRNLAAIKDGNGVIPVANGQTIGNELKPGSQVIFLQNVTTAQPKIYSANVINQADPHDQLPPGIYQTITTTSSSNGAATTATSTATTNGSLDEQSCEGNAATTTIVNAGEPIQANVVITVNGVVNDESTQQQQQQQQVTSDYAPSHTDRLADLVKNAQITASPLGTFHEAFDCSKPDSPPPATPTQQPTSDESSASSAAAIGNIKPRVKSSHILSAAERTERCNICGFSFPDRNILLLHKQLVHMVQEKDANAPPEDVMKNYPCHLCTKLFKMRGSLMVHMRVAHPGINTGFSRESLQHKEYGNDQDSEPPDIEGGYNCPTCGKNFKKEQHVVQHLKIHEGKQYECDVCSKMFTTKYFLKKHKRLHSGEMPYKCTICDKTFTFQQSFHKHRLYHKDDKPHSCITCGRSFKELSTLHNHERIHTGEKPFACETCGKCFRQRVSYLVHRRIHTGVMPYKCSACGKNFRYKVSQRTHKCTQQPPGVVVQQSGAFSQNSQALTEMHNQSEKSQTIETPEVSEENKYVVMLGSEGRPELKRKSEVESDDQPSLSKSSTNLDKEHSNDTDDFIQSIWSQDSTSAMEYKEIRAKADEIVSNAIKESNIWNETTDSRDSTRLLEDSISKHFGSNNGGANSSSSKEVANNEFTNGMWNSNREPAAAAAAASEVNYQKSRSDENRLNNTNDLFSMVMSPLENEMPSPSTEMEHLRLSSPANNQDNSTADITDCFPTLATNSPRPVQVVGCNEVEPNFPDNGSTGNNLSTLQSINEDSLKELLYGIVDK